MSELPRCPECGSEYTYEDGSMYVCPECAHGWAIDAAVESTDDIRVFRDAHGNMLVDGDTVTVIKDLKIKGRRQWSRSERGSGTSAWSMAIIISTARSTASGR